MFREQFAKSRRVKAFWDGIKTSRSSAPVELLYVWFGSLQLLKGTTFRTNGWANITDPNAFSNLHIWMEKQ